MDERLITLEAEGVEQEITIEQEAIIVNKPAGEIEITANGNYDVGQYATAEVAVEKPTATISITENGEYDVANYATAKVQTTSGEVSITENGTFDVDKYQTAKVQTTSGEIEITSNGTVDVDKYQTATVKVPGIPEDEIFNTTVESDEQAFSFFSNWLLKTLPSEITLASSVTSLQSFINGSFYKITGTYTIKVTGGGTITTIRNAFAWALVNSDVTFDLTALTFSDDGVDMGYFANSAGCDILLPAISASSLSGAYSQSARLEKTSLHDFSMISTEKCTSFNECFANIYSAKGTFILSGWSNTQGASTSNMFYYLATNSVGYTNYPLNIIIDSPQVFTLTDGGEFNNSRFVQEPTSSDAIGIYVPDDLVDEYKAATGWSAVAVHIKPLSEWSGTE